MKTKIPNERLYNSLGLLYESSFVATQLTDEPSSQLDIPAFIEGKDHCWQSLNNSKIRHKKTLILTSWYFQQFEQHIVDVLTEFFGDLIDEGFTIYAPEKQDFIKLTDKERLTFDFTPISTTTARKLAAKHQLSNDHTVVFNIQRLHELIKNLKENNVTPYAEKISAFYCHNYPRLPLNPRQQPAIQDIEKHLESGDKFSCVLDFPGSVSDDILACISHLGNFIKQLNIGWATLTSQKLSAIFTSAPSLEKISISGCKISGNTPLKLRPGQLKHLTQLKTTHASINAQQFSSIIEAAPNIVTLDVSSRKKLHGALLSLRPWQLGQLTKFIAQNSQITIEELSTVIAAAPKLATIDISNCTRLGEAPLRLQPGQLLQLTTLKAEGALISAQQFTAIMTTAPNLSTIEISDTNRLFDILLTLKSSDLNHLTALYANDLAITADQLSHILTAAPNLSTISINMCQDLGAASLNLKPGALPNLKLLAASSSSITFKQIATIILAAPNLEMIDLSFCNDINDVFVLYTEQIKSIAVLVLNSSLDLERFQDLFNQNVDLNPDQEINDIDCYRKKLPLLKPDCMSEDNLSSCPPSESESGLESEDEPQGEQHSTLPPLKSSVTDGFSKQSVQLNTITLDGKLSNDTPPSFQVQQMFKGHRNQPPSTSYHLQSFDWVRPHSLVNYRPQSKDLERMHAVVFPALQAVQTAFTKAPEYSTDHHFYSPIDLGPLKPGTWYQLPALSPHDQLLGYATNLDKYDILRDKISGYHYLSVPRPVPSCLINYIIESKPHLNEVVRKEHSPLQRQMQMLTFDATGQLVKNKAYFNLAKCSKNRLITALSTFCDFPQPSSKDISGTPIAILNHLIKNRAGACRHRSMLFVALASELGITAHVVINTPHAFVTVVDDQQQVHTINLGGAPSNVHEIPMKLVLEPIEETQKTPEPFETWNNYPLKANTFPSLANELKRQDNPITRRLLIMENEQAIEALHNAVLDTNGLSFFTPNLDTLSLKTLKATDGPYVIVGTPLAIFLKEAQLHPEQPMTWFINWSHPKSEHVGLNSIIDDVDRQFGHIALPPNLHIVAVMDSSSAETMGEDFYSRFDAINQARMRDETNLPVTESLSPIGPNDALLTNADDWQKELIGFFHINDKNIVFKPGALIRAIDNQAPSLLIHNAPWENPAFRWFMRELQKTKRVFANGRSYSLPEGLQIECVKPLFTYPELEKPLSEAQEYVLNSITYPSFFSHFRVNSTNAIESCPGFLMPHAALRILVTEALSEAQWYKVWEEAHKKSCRIELLCTPNVTAPEALSPWVIQTATRHPQKPIVLIVSNDIDGAEEHYCPDAIHIPINLNSRFETLFCSIHRQEQHFIYEETALLQAIHAGKPILFKGRFSKALAQQLQTLFANPPSLYINGKTILIQSPIILITDDPQPFIGIEYQTINYEPNCDIQKLSESLQTRLKSAYQALEITPCHSHFSDLPHDKSLHEDWVNIKIQQLNLSTGQLEGKNHATQPEDVLDYLAYHPFVFLLSETGVGKSYFVEHLLREYGAAHDRPISIHHGLGDLKTWAKSEGESILFIDEANLSAEHFHVFNNLAHGEHVIWLDGQCYPLSPKHKVVFAGNPKHYGERFEADLFKHFPYFLEFKGQDLATILTPLLAFFKTKQELLPIIEDYYQKAIKAGLNITPRNAQMMCVSAFALQQLPLLKQMPESLLMHYAALHQIQSLSADLTFNPPLDLRPHLSNIDQAHAAQLPSFATSHFIWTASRKKIALTVQTLLLIREQKIEKNIDQAAGINGVVLEGEPGFGKSRLLISLLEAQQIPCAMITIGKPNIMRQQLLEAFHEGRMVIIDELNSFPDEQLLNALLSGTDLEGNPPRKPGFCLLATQNPSTYQGRQILSKALSNRLITLVLNHYEDSELHQILEEKFKLSEKEAIQLTARFIASRHYAEQQKLFPPPNLRTLFNQAGKQLEKTKDTFSNASLAARVNNLFYFNALACMAEAGGLASLIASIILPNLVFAAIGVGLMVVATTYLYQRNHFFRKPQEGDHANNRYQQENLEMGA